MGRSCQGRLYLATVELMIHSLRVPLVTGLNSIPATSSPTSEEVIIARLDELADLVWLRDHPEDQSFVRTATDRELAVLGASPDDRSCCPCNRPHSTKKKTTAFRPPSRTTES